MARAHLRHTVKDRAGNVVQNALVYAYAQGTTTAVTDMYAAATGGSPISTLTSNAQGEVEGWFTTPKTVDLKVTDNTDAAYYPSAPGTLLAFSDFTETIEVRPSLENRLVVNVMDYGAVGDGTTNDSAAIQAAVTAAGASVYGGIVHFPPGKNYRLQTGITLPTGITDGSLVLSGHGARISTIGAITAFDRQMTDQTVAAASTGKCDHWVIEGFRFRSDGNAASRAIRLHSGHHVKVEQCYFANFNIAVEFRFMLYGMITKCQFINGLSGGYNTIIGSGDWASATPSNSTSSSVLELQNRHAGQAGMAAHTWVRGSSGCRIINNVYEGGAPVKTIHFDTVGGTSIRSFVIQGVHLEHVPTECFLYARGTGTVIVMEQVEPLTGTPVIFKGDAASSDTSLVLRDWGYWAGGTEVLNGTGLRNAFFTGVAAGAGSPPDFNATSHWVTGTKPSTVTQWDADEFSVNSIAINQLITPAGAADTEITIPTGYGLSLQDTFNFTLKLGNTGNAGGSQAQIYRGTDANNADLIIQSSNGLRLNGASWGINKVPTTTAAAAADASDLATAITLVNDLKAKLIAKGVVS